jgi:hypothetical protein
MRSKTKNKGMVYYLPPITHTEEKKKEDAKELHIVPDFGPKPKAYLLRGFHHFHEAPQYKQYNVLHMKQISQTPSAMVSLS